MAAENIQDKNDSKVNSDNTSGNSKPDNSKTYERQRSIYGDQKCLLTLDKITSKMDQGIGDLGLTQMNIVAGRILDRLVMRPKTHKVEGIENGERVTHLQKDVTTARFETNETLAKIYNCPIDTVKRAFAYLTKKKLIVTKYDPKTRLREYALSPMMLAYLSGDSFSISVSPKPRPSRAKGTKSKSTVHYPYHGHGALPAPDHGALPAPYSNREEIKKNNSNSRGLGKPPSKPTNTSSISFDLINKVTEFAPPQVKNSAFKQLGKKYGNELVNQGLERMAKDGIKIYWPGTQTNGSSSHFPVDQLEEVFKVFIE